MFLQICCFLRLELRVTVLPQACRRVGSLHPMGNLCNRKLVGSSLFLAELHVGSKQAGWVMHSCDHWFEWELLFHHLLGKPSLFEFQGFADLPGLIALVDWQIRSRLVHNRRLMLHLSLIVEVAIFYSCRILVIDN